MKFKSQTSTRLQFGGMRLDSATSTKDEQLVNVGGNNQNKTKKSKNKKKLYILGRLPTYLYIFPLGISISSLGGMISALYGALGL